MLDRSMSSLGKSQLQLCTHVKWKNRKMKMGFMGVWQQRHLVTQMKNLPVEQKRKKQS